jgi:hypothetical protein
MSDVIESIEYKPEIPLDNTEVRSIKIVFQNEVHIETTTGDSYKAAHLYIMWGTSFNSDFDSQHRSRSSMDSWLKTEHKLTRVEVNRIETVEERPKVTPIEVLHSIIVTAHGSNTDTDESAAEGEHVSADNTDESEQSLTSQLYERARELLTP